MSDKYILDAQGKVVPEPDLLKWGRWFEDHRDQRIVAKTKVGDCEVSTVFLGLDHSWGKGAPILWETMVFGPPFQGEMDRCSGNREQAEAMHERMVKKVSEKACK